MENKTAEWSFAIMSVFTYLVFSFFSKTFDISNWNYVVRVVFFALILIAGFISYLLKKIEL